MICPKCGGTAQVAVNGGAGQILVLVCCDYPGCFAGKIHCCEGECAQPQQKPAAAAIEAVKAS